MRRILQRAEYAELVALFLIQGAALGMWLVPLSTVLDAHGLGSLRPYAFATSSMAAFVAPLFFGAMADRHVSPVKVLRILAICSASAMTLAAVSIGQGWNRWAVLALIQVYSLFSAPSWSIGSSIIFARLKDPSREFGPIRASATIGWMLGCLIVSALGADRSVMSAYCGAVTWLGVAGLTLLLPSVEPPASSRVVTLRERFGLDALVLLRDRNHRGVFITVALLNIPLAAFYPHTPPHLRDLGLGHTSAWMSLGQISEVLVMVSLSWLITRWRLKWIFAAGLGFSVVRFALSSFDRVGWLLAGVSLHGFSYALVFITAQIYLDGRVDPAWRARAQALLFLMTSGVGNFFGYIGTGWWMRMCSGPGGTRWPQFWQGLAVCVAVVMGFFLISYRGREGGRAAVESGA